MVSRVFVLKQSYFSEKSLNRKLTKNGINKPKLFTGKSLVIFFAIISFLGISQPFSVHALGVPNFLGYQGRLADSNGNLLGGTDGLPYYFKFSIWDNATVDSGAKLWPAGDPEIVSSTVREGVFNINIGDTSSGYPDALEYNFNTSKNIYLQVEVSSSGGSGTFETLSPRQKFSSSVFAMLAGAVSGVGQSSFGTTTPFAASVVSIQATSTQSIGLTIRGMLGQLANLFQIQNSTGTSLFAVNNDGKVGVGTGAPSRKFDVLDANSDPQLRLSQTSSTYGEIYIDPGGDAWLSSTGGNIRQGDENLWVCEGDTCNEDAAPASKGNIILENALIFNNKSKLKQSGASTTIMYDTAGNAILEFDEEQ
ncbi:MAG: hypothetical protein NTW60_02970 [Candidatus Wolfebacteria bacterium]|nr:hypothetical protein [Candidatus Wolfebacteria bacterium]